MSPARAGSDADAGARGSAPRDRSSRVILSWLARAAGRRGIALVGLLCALQALMAALSVSLAPLMQHAVDRAVARDGDGFRAFAIAFGAVIAVQIALRAVTYRQAELTRATLDNRLRGRAFADVLALPAREAERRHSAELMSRMTSDVSVVTDGLASLPPTLVSMVIRMVGVLVVMYVLAPGLALAFVLVGAGMTVVSTVLRRELKRRHRAVQEAESRMRCFIQEVLESLLVVHAFGVEGKMRARSEERMRDHMRARMRKNAIGNLGGTGFSAAIQAGYVLGFAWCGAGIVAGTLSYGTLVAVIQLIGQIQAPFANLGGMFSRWASTLSSAERLMDVGEVGESRAGEGLVYDGRAGERAARGVACPAPVPATAAALYTELDRIRFDRVAFRYDADKPALEGIDAVLPRGSFTAIVGPSGVGKSTLMKILLAAYEPQAGSVLLEGHGSAGSWACAPEQAPAGLFAYVPQGNRLMAGTVREAVAFAETGPAPDEARVAAACRAACADGFVAELPQGLDTRLGERGAGLSEGQMQRLAVARAVYSRAPIMLLDEATSALDAATEAEMLARLRALPGLTIVIVTHRAEVLSLCDQVIRLEEGRIRS